MCHFKGIPLLCFKQLSDVNQIIEEGSYMKKRIFLFFVALPLLLLACSSNGNEQNSAATEGPVFEVFRSPT